MEIRDYIAAIRRRLWLPILLSLLAGVATAAFLQRQPAEYQATATVIVPALSAKGYSTSAVTQYVSTYKDVLVSAPVVAQVAAETGAKPSELTTGLTASTATASSNIIQVTFTGTHRTVAPVIVRSAAVHALDVLAGPQLAAAKFAIAASQAELDQTNKALGDFTTQTGLLVADQEFRLKEAELSQLLIQLEEARLAGDTNRAGGLQKIIDARQKEIAALAPKVVQYQQLYDAKTAAESAHNHALQQLADVNAMLSSNHDAATVTVKILGKVSKLPTLARFGGIAIAVTLLLSLGYLVLMELIRPARRAVAMPVRTAQTVRVPVGTASHDSHPAGVSTGRS